MLIIMGFPVKRTNFFYRGLHSYYNLQTTDDMKKYRVLQ